MESKYSISIDKIKKIIGVKIYTLRIKKNLTAKSLAKSSNVDASYISILESGLRLPSLETLYAIAQALEVSISELLTEHDDIKNSPVEPLLPEILKIFLLLNDQGKKEVINYAQYTLGKKP